MQLLSDPARVRLLMILEQREASVQELADELGATHQNVSHHLGVMYRDGVLSRRKDGTTVFYAISDFTACRVLEQVLASVTAQIEELGELVSTS
jgi:DNA-binding transcriptional ArsR family regulator